MTDDRATSRAGAMRYAAMTTVLLAGALLAGCAPNPGGGVAGSRLRVYAADTFGAAKVCEVPKVDPVAGQTVEAKMIVGNDGGWCGIRMHQDGPKPYGAGLLTTRPGHGAVTIHVVGDDTRIDYTPDRKFTGSDGFAVRLVPGDATVQVTVAVAGP
jgi:hypothetical protein